LCGIDLIAWTQHLLLDGDLAVAEPKKLRYRLLHVAARITRSARRTRLRIAEGWPWADQLVTACARLGRTASTRHLNNQPTPRRAPWRNPTTASGHLHAPTTVDRRTKINHPRTALDQQLAKGWG
jgi:hypothetical protein